MVAIQSTTTIWRIGEEPLPLKQKRHRGVERKRTVLQHRRGCVPLAVLDLAQGLRPKAFSKITWREGANGALRSRFAALRVHAANRDQLHHEIRPQEWLLIEWPSDGAAPRKYWLSNLPETTSLSDLVTHAQRRWRIERHYQELKDEIGLDHFEGRVGMAFITARHCALPLTALSSRNAAFFPLQTSAPLYRSPVIFHLAPMPRKWKSGGVSPESGFYVHNGSQGIGSQSSPPQLRSAHTCNRVKAAIPRYRRCARASARTPLRRSLPLR